MKNLRPIFFSACFLVLLALVYLGGGYINDKLNVGRQSPPVIYEDPYLRAANVTVTMANAPSGNGEYFGTLAPYLLITYERTGGGLNRVFNYAEASPKTNTGVDLCQSTLVFDRFYVVAPTGGAMDSTENVTYASETYTFPPVSTIPGGDRCGARFNVETTWEILLCAEGDGRIDLPKAQDDGSTLVDSWDFCEVFEYHGKAAGTQNLLLK